MHAFVISMFCAAGSVEATQCKHDDSRGFTQITCLLLTCVVLMPACTAGMQVHRRELINEG